MDFGFVLDVTQEDIEALMRQARQAHDRGSPVFQFQGRNIAVAKIFDGPADPVVQAIEQLHILRCDEYSQGQYRGDKFRG